MSVLLAWFLAGGGGLPVRLQDPEPPPPPRTETFLRARGGVYASHSFSFLAVRSSGLQVELDAETLGSAGLDVGVSIRERALLFASVEASGGDGLAVRTAGLYVGIRERLRKPYPPAMPHEVSAYAGGLWGSVDVKEEGFGDFKDAWGFGAGLEFTWFLSRRWALGLIGEYRLLRFRYDEDVLSGDTRLGGSGGWGGASLEVRF